MSTLLAQLQKRYAKGERFDYLFFWGHRPNADGSIGKSCLSQWWFAPFEVEGQQYLTAEHWMMAEKARLFGDEEILAKILAATSPHQAKKLGRKVANFVEAEWKAHRYAIVVEGNYHKFSQHSDLESFLGSTGGKVLVEASPYDRIWGIGFKQDVKGIEDPYSWKGQNLLGFALMEVRERLVKKA